jgi:hypothetical protein
MSVADNNQGTTTETWQNVAFYVLVFTYYFVNFFVIVFFNTALVSCALMRFTGGAPTLGDGLRTALARLPQIVGWALLSATVGVILKALEERLSFLGKIVVAVIGVAWAIVTYLVIPVLAAEQVGPITAVRRSASLLRKSWGESLVGGISLSAVSFLLAIPGIILLVAGVAIGVAAKPVALVIAIVVLGVFYLIGLAIVVSTLQQVFLAGVYLYAAQGRVPGGFSEDSLISAFKVKK